MTDPFDSHGQAEPSQKAIQLAHGGGGQLTDELLASVILPRLGNAVLDELLDSAVLEEPAEAGRPAVTIDSYVVTPWRFPGGDIGRLAVCGTVNDLAVCGAEVLAITLSCILAEGFAQHDFEQVLDSVAEAAREAGVRVVAGDTKVVGRGQADGIYLTTAGLGWIPQGVRWSPREVRPGDVLLVNGPVGEHGLAVMLARELPEVQTALRSDAAPLNGLLRGVLRNVNTSAAFARDATRGGLAGVAADLARQSGYRVVLEEAHIPIRPEAHHAAEMLGLDLLEVANEGKVVLVVRPEAAETALAALRAHPQGREAAIIGYVDQTCSGLCELLTTIGGRRILQKPYGEQLPRIC